MKKQFKLEELDCANCAAFMEEAINKLPEVKHATVSFMMARLVIEADDDASRRARGAGACFLYPSPR